MFFRMRQYNNAPKASSINAIGLMIIAIPAIAMFFAGITYDNYLLAGIAVIIYAALHTVLDRVTDKMAVEEAAQRAQKEAARIAQLDPVSQMKNDEEGKNEQGRFTYPAQLTIVRKSSIYGALVKLKYIITNSETDEEIIVKIGNKQSQTVQVYYKNNVVSPKATIGQEDNTVNIIASPGEKITLTYTALKLVKVERQ